MDKVLNQEQIDNLVRNARGHGEAGGEPSEPHVVAWDARLAGQIGNEQMQSVTSLHEGFARKLTHVLGAYLRIAFEAKLVSAEYLTYGDFLHNIPEPSYMASCKLVPLAATALLYMDLAVAFPLLDVLLGGEGKGAPPARELTEIEEQILEIVVRIILQELQTAWQVLALEFQFDQRQQPQEVQHLMSLEEKTLSLSFEITLAESRGTLNLAVPAVVSSALLHKISSAWIRPKPKRQFDSNQRLRDRLLDCPFQVELGIGAAQVPMRELMQLQIGNLLILRRRVEEPAGLIIGNQELFSAAVAKRGSVRAAQVIDHFHPPNRKGSSAND